MKKVSILLVLSILFTINISAQDKYKIEKAHIEYVTQTMGMSMESTLDFDNYGKNQVITAVINMMGMNKTSKILTHNGYTYILDMETKSGTKTPAEDGDQIEEVDFSNIPQEIKDKHKIVELGEETVAGKTCQVFSMESEGIKSKLWVWKNIPVKTEADQGGMTVVMEAKKIDTNPSFPVGTFEVPKDFSITDME